MERRRTRFKSEDGRVGVGVESTSATVSHVLFRKYFPFWVPADSHESLLSKQSLSWFLGI